MSRSGVDGVLGRRVDIGGRESAAARPDDLSDAALLAQVARRSEAALAALYTRYGGLIFTLALRIVGDRTLAEEVMQDTFLRCWDRVETYHPRAGHVAAWLMGIARNRAIDVLRGRQHQARLREQGGELDPQLPDPDQRPLAELAELRQSVAAALAELPAAQRHVVELARYGGLTQAEIARELGAPPGTVKAHTRAALECLRTLLLPLLSDTPDGGER